MGLCALDEHYLLRAIELAERARGRTFPNPIVGAVVAFADRILGEGFHERAGSDHAEIAAMKAAAPGEEPPRFGGKLRGATLYVSLEPCVHHGRTPPCVDAIVAAGIGRVVIAAIDPSAKVSGQGVRRLREAGIVVDIASGELERRARRQNGPFRKWSTSGLPFITYKFAMSLDGKVATFTGDSKWISCEQARQLVHEERACSDAVLIGAATMRRDDPLLTARGAQVLRQPMRVVIDPELSISRESRLVQSIGEAPVMVICASEVPTRRRMEVAAWGAEVVAVARDERGLISATAVAEVLGSRGIQSVLLEGGPTTAAAFWQAGLVDKVMAFVAPLVLGGTEAPGPLPVPGFRRVDEALRLKDAAVQVTGDNALLVGYLTDPY